MNKQDLINELKTSEEDTSSIFLKGYLNYFNMDSEIFAVLLPRLVTEANDLMYLGNIILDTPDLVSEEMAEEFTKKGQEFYNLVYSNCVSEVFAIPYVEQSINCLKNKASKSFISKIKAYQNQGYEFFESPHTGALSITSAEGLDFFNSKEFVPAKTVIKELGVDTENSYYPLFYFGMFPKEELDTYRLVYAYCKAFDL